MSTCINTSINTDFWGKVDIREPHECWLWNGGRKGKNYGAFVQNSVSEYAHRYAWTICFGVIPNDLFVLHRCDTPLCVNPGHLFLGTQLLNLQDMARKRRGANQFTRHQRVRQPSEHAFTSFSDELRAEIETEYRMGGISMRSLATKHHVSASTVWKIINYGSQYAKSAR